MNELYLYLTTYPFTKETVFDCFAMADSSRSKRTIKKTDKTAQLEETIKKKLKKGKVKIFIRQTTTTTRAKEEP